MSATEEMRHTVAQANATLDEDGNFINDLVSTRQNGDYTLAPRENVNLIDVSPKAVGICCGLVDPVLGKRRREPRFDGVQHATSGCSAAACRGTVGRDGYRTALWRAIPVLRLRRNVRGVVDQIDAQRIVIRATSDLELGDAGVDIYRMRKFQRSNQNTCINQRPLVKVGQTVTKGEVIADGPSTDMGELALGKNVVVAFMPWNGYNYEDSILISERIAQ